MKPKWTPELVGWVLIPLLFAALLGVSPRPRAWDADLQGARRSLEGGDPLRAASRITAVLARQPWRTGLWETVGRAALAGGDPAQALQALQTARTAHRITPEGLLALGDAYAQTAQPAAALPAWAAALAAGAPPAEVHARQLEVHRAAGDYAAAIEDLRALTALDPTNARARYQLGLLLAAREPEAALAYLIQAEELDPSLAQAVRLLQNKIRDPRSLADPAFTLVNAGRALAVLEEWELAAEAFHQATLIAPAYAEAWAFLGEARQHLGHGGFPDLQTALALAPDSFTANTLAALYWKRQGEPAQALAYLEAAATAEPESPSTQAEIASTLQDLGDLPAALAHYLRATELAPTEATYWHLLAQFSVRNEVQIEAVGLAAARRALLLDKDDPVALDLVGYGYFLLHDFVSAARFLGEALQSRPDYAPAHLHLGLVYLAEGEPGPARLHLLRAVALAPGTSTAEQAGRILAQYFPGNP